MRSKTVTPVSKSKARHTRRQPSPATMVPELRFPEFRGDGGWEEKKLGDKARITKGKGISKAEIVLDGHLKCIRYGELYTHYSEIITTIASRTNVPEARLTLSRKDDVIIPASGETSIDIATASCVRSAGVAIGSDLNIIRSDLYGPFLSYYLSGPKKHDIAARAQGVSVMHLYPSQLETLKVSFPSLPEQQKIADCLSSLDDLIAAHDRKLNALEKHKKGLMQGLFPAEKESEKSEVRSEKIPRLRFPEFRGDGGWEEKIVDKLCRVAQGGTPDTSISKYWNGAIQWITPAEMGKDKSSFATKTIRTITEEGLRNCSSALLPKHSVILSTRAPIGHLVINQVPMAINQGCRGLIPCPKVEVRFLYYGLYRATRALNDLGSGNTFKELSGKTLKKFKLATPSLPEQRKIADALSALDTLIAAQIEKIAVLKQYKNGLMQQLFPDSEQR